MSYAIIFSNTAANQYEKLKDKKLKDRIAAAFEYIAGDPLVGKPLQGELKGCYSCRIGDYRAVYNFCKRTKTIGVIRINHRRDVYR